VPPAALRAALVDPEGVLFDLRAERARAVGDALAAAGVAAGSVGPDAIARAAALPAGAAVRAAVAAAAAAGDAAAAACDEVALDIAAHRADRAFSGLLARAALTLADGAREAVAALGARLRLGVVTRLRRADADRLLEAAALAPAFAFVVAADDRLAGPARAGAPGARYAAALARLARPLAGLAGGEVAALVGAAADADDARAAGLRTVLVGADDPARRGARRVRRAGGRPPHRGGRCRRPGGAPRRRRTTYLVARPHAGRAGVRPRPRAHSLHDPAHMTDATTAAPTHPVGPAVLDYGDPAAEYAALRAGALLVDHSRATSGSSAARRRARRSPGS
jgi:phosphoglycolate phosphatase-like HAD superfamily hydrolase